MIITTTESTDIDRGMGYNKTWMFKIDKTTIGCFSLSPNGNCQTASVEYMESILAQKTEDCLHCLKEIKKYTKKPMILVDVRGSVVNKLKTIFPRNSIVLEAPYISSNGSSMVIYLLKLEWLK